MLILLGKGCALLYAGDLKAAAAAFSDAAAATQTFDDGHLKAECLGQLAMVEAVQGHLRRAAELGKRANTTADRCELRNRARSAAADVALAWVHTEGCDLMAARVHADRAADSVAIHRDLVGVGLLAIVRARNQRARGDIGGAVDTIERASSDCPANPTPGWLSGRLAVIHAALRAASGSSETVGAVQGGTARDEAVRASPHGVVVQALARLVSGAPAEANALVSPVLSLVDAPLDTRVEAWLLTATCELVQGRIDLARTALEQALRLAAPERLRRPIFETSPRLRRFLRQTPELTQQHQWLGAPGEASAEARHAVRRNDTNEGSTLVVMEALTEKETEVLRHLAAMLSTEEIARTMFVSVNTVKTHVRGVLRKLSAARRNEAVRRARELGLV